MDFVKREDQNLIEEENYKVYLESLQKSHQTEMNDYQHTPISMEQLHQAMQTSLSAGNIMHNFQLPLSPRQMSTLMLKTNHLSRNLNFNDIPAHFQRNLELDLVHNLANELPPNLRPDELLMSRNLDLNIARINELELQNGLTQTLVQNLNENLGLGDVLPHNLRSDLPHDLNHEIDLSHHLNRNIEQEMLNQERRTPMQLQDGLLEQNLVSRLEVMPQRVEQGLSQRLDQTLSQRLDQTLSQRLDQTLSQRLDQSLSQRLDQSINPRLDHTGQRLDQRLATQNMMHESSNEHMLPMPFHIKAEQEDDGYFYDNINQPLPSVNMNGHMADPTPNQGQMYVYSNVGPMPSVNSLDIYSRPQNYPQNYTPTPRDNPQNLVIHKQFENHSPYEEVKKDGGGDGAKIDNQKMEEPKENLKPNENKMYYQEYQNYEAVKSEDKLDDGLSKEFDIRGEYICFKCNVIFPSKRSLKQHTKTCENNGEESDKLGKFSCAQCPYRCQAPATLKIHERIHTGVKPYSCNFCSYKSGQKNNVAKHILVHMKQKPFRCQYCDYRCAQKNNLVVHERTHTGYKPFACPYCDYRTVQKPNLVKHMYLHTDQKPFSCDICNYKCVQKTNLTKHKQRHINEKEGEKLDVKSQVKPYRPRQKSVKCPHCAYRCVQKSSLEKHILFKHNELTEGLNLMKGSDSCEESIQNLSVKKDLQMFEEYHESKDVQTQS